MNKQEAQAQFAAGLKRIQDDAADAVKRLKTSVGDQDGDGDVDLADVRIRIEHRTGPIGPRELAFFTVGFLACFAVVKVLPLILRLFTV